MAIPVAWTTFFFIALFAFEFLKEENAVKVPIFCFFSLSQRIKMMGCVFLSH